jgi:4-hydroxy-2-oxoheptanedioate aldolase
VRPAWNDIVLIKRILDLGVQTLLVPYVQSAEEARRAVAATRYRPKGVRGIAATIRANRYGRIKDYHAQASREMCVLVQLETRRALCRAGGDRGRGRRRRAVHRPQRPGRRSRYLGNNRHPEAVAVFADACARAKKVGKPIGILAPVEEDARRYLEMGFTTWPWAATSACSATRRRPFAPGSRGRASHFQSPWSTKPAQ